MLVKEALIVISCVVTSLVVTRVHCGQQYNTIQIKSYSALSYRGGRECITLSKCEMKQMSLESAAESRMVIDDVFERRILRGVDEPCV